MKQVAKVIFTVCFMSAGSEAYEQCMKLRSYEIQERSWSGGTAAPFTYYQSNPNPSPFDQMWGRKE